MEQHTISEKQALCIVGEFVDEIRKEDAAGILAVYLIGSLGGGYYRAGESDIDTVILVRDDAAITQARMDEIASGYWKRYQVPKGFGSIMIRESELQPPYNNSQAEDFEFTVEIARLKTQGKAVFGTYDLNSVPMPDKAYLIRDAKIMEKWLEGEFGYPMFNKLGVTGCINCILGTMRRYLMVEKRIFEFNKFLTTAKYLENNPALSDPELFDFIRRYLEGDDTEKDVFLPRLRDFGIRLRDHYNRTLLGIEAPKDAATTEEQLSCRAQAIPASDSEF